MTTRILVGDAREQLATIPEQSVHCCVTSPPYYGLRDYGVPGQIGLEPTLAEYIATMVDVFRAVRRVLRDDGTLFLNVGDSYYGAGYSNHANTGGATREQGGKQRHSYRGGVQREDAYGKRGKAPEDSRDRGCLCESLCDACRVAYRTGIAHICRQPVPTLSPSLSAPNLGHTASLSDHLPTSGSMAPDSHTGDAIPGLALAVDLGGVLPPDVRASSPDESSLLLLASCSPDGTQGGECRLCGRSLRDSVPASARMVGCNCDTVLHGLDSRNQGMGASGLAYPHYTTASRLKPKDLMMVPARLAIALQDDGWYLRSDIIWHKKAPMPESVTDRPTSAHEHIFLLTKCPRYYYDADAVREPNETESNVRTKAEETWGKAARLSPTGDGEREWNNPAGRNQRNVWTLGPEPFPLAHFATFPTEIPRRCIKAGTSEHGVCAACGAPWVRVVEREPENMSARYERGEPARHGANGAAASGASNVGAFSGKAVTTGWAPSCACGGDPVPATVLDIFLGSGTTLLVADQLGRDGIGVELNPAYAEMSRKRIYNDAPLFAHVV